MLRNRVNVLPATHFLLSLLYWCDFLMYGPQAEVKKPNISPKQNSSGLLQFCYFYTAEFLSYHGGRHHLSPVDQEFNVQLTHSRQHMDATNQKAVTPSNQRKTHKSTQLRTNKRISCLSAGLLFIYSCNDTTLWRYIWASRHVNTIIVPPQDFRSPPVCFAMLVRVAVGKRSRFWQGCSPPWVSTKCHVGVAQQGAEELLCQVNTSALFLGASNISWTHFANIHNTWGSGIRRPIHKLTGANKVLAKAVAQTRGSCKERLIHSVREGKKKAEG